MTRARLNKDFGDIAAMANGFAEHFGQVNDVLSLVFNPVGRAAMRAVAGDLKQGGRKGMR